MILRRNILQRSERHTSLSPSLASPPVSPGPGSESPASDLDDADIEDRRLESHHVHEMGNREDSHSVDPSPAHHTPDAGSLDPAADPDDPDEPHIEYHPKAPRIFGSTNPTYDRIRQKDGFSEHRRENPFYPFSCYDDWEMARWLSKAGLSQELTDEFFRLQYVRW